MSTNADFADWAQYPILRPEDGETVGYLVPSGAEWLALSLIGLPLGPPSGRDDALELAYTSGLSSLDREWWCRAPRPFPTTEAELRAPSENREWRRVVIVEISRATCTIRPALAGPQERTRTVSFALPAPIGKRGTEDVSRWYLEGQCRESIRRTGRHAGVRR